MIYLCATKIAIGIFFLNVPSKYVLRTHLDDYASLIITVFTVPGAQTVKNSQLDARTSAVCDAHFCFILQCLKCIFYDELIKVNH